MFFYFILIHVNLSIFNLYFILAKERLNSRIYDNILKILRMSSELDKHNEQLDLKYSKALFQEIEQIKNLMEYDQIIGISQLNEHETKEYITNNKITNIYFIIDENNEISRLNSFASRYELVINNLVIETYRVDPTIRLLSLNAIMLITGLIMTSIVIIKFIKFIVINHIEIRKDVPLLLNQIRHGM